MNEERRAQQLPWRRELEKPLLIGSLVSENPDCDFPACIIGVDWCRWGAKPCYLWNDEDIAKMEEIFADMEAANERRRNDNRAKV